MKVKHLFYPVFISFFLLSCSNADDFADTPSIPYKSEGTMLTIEEINSLNPNSGLELTESEIIKVVTEFIDQINDNSLNVTTSSGAKTRSQSSTKQLSITDKYYLGENSITRSGGGSYAPVYEVSIKNEDGTKGLVVIAADDRLPSVISYVPVNELSGVTRSDRKANENIAHEKMLSIAKATYKHKVEKIAEAQKIKPFVIQKISEGLNISESEVDEEAINSYILKFGAEANNMSKYMAEENTETRAKPREEPASRVIRSYGRPCGTLWHQNEPFNMFYEKTWVNYFGDAMEWGYPPAGCGVIAIAQIMAALEPAMRCGNINIDWRYLKEKKTIVGGGYFGDWDPTDKLNMVAALVCDIRNKSQSTPQYKEGYNNEWPSRLVTGIAQYGTTSSNVYNYFQNASGVTVCNYGTGMIKWDPEIVRQSLFASFPVFVGGNGHAFVIDEFICAAKSLTTRMLIKQYDVYFHCNFGWGEETGTGYYLVEDTENGTITFETGLGNYIDNQMSILTHIGKKTL